MNRVGRKSLIVPGRVLVRKSRSLLDRPLSWFEVRESETPFRAPLTYSERVVFRELSHLLEGADLVVHDIGAASGVYTSMFAKVASVGAVYAFEPVPSAYDALVRRVGRFQHVQCVNVAIGDGDGRHTLYEYSFSDASSLLRMEKRQVQLLPSSTNVVERQIDVRRLDDLIESGTARPPDLIKVDVQGYEGHVLKGAQSALEHARYCVIEMSFVPMYEGSWLFRDAYTYLVERGYEMIGVAGPVVNPLGRALQIDGVFRRSE